MSDKYTMVFTHRERERLMDLLGYQVQGIKNYSLIDADLLSRLQGTLPDTPEPSK